MLRSPSRHKNDVALSCPGLESRCIIDATPDLIDQNSKRCFIPVFWKLYRLYPVPCLSSCQINEYFTQWIRNNSRCQVVSVYVTNWTWTFQKVLYGQGICNYQSILATNIRIKEGIISKGQEICKLPGYTSHQCIYILKLPVYCIVSSSWRHRTSGVGQGNLNRNTGNQTLYIGEDGLAGSDMMIDDMIWNFV